MKHPYANLPASSFWKKSVASLDATEVDPITDVPFVLRTSDRIATAGSCFAQHISRTLIKQGFHYLVAEDGPVDQNYRVFPARFGNLYTTRQLLQLFQRAYGLFVPTDTHWTLSNNCFVDPFRPQVHPGGFDTIAALSADRDTHLKAVRQMFEECDVFIFTLGLTEGWRSKEDGAVFPLAPGVSGSPADSDKYEFHNFTVEEMAADMREFIEKLRVVNPAVRIILTVSPVPLVATYENRHVLVSTIYSKSALRVVAEMVSRDDPDVAYFPSYEIITGHHTGYSFFEEDLRSVSSAGVDHVMALFSKHFLDKDGNASTATKRSSPKTREFDESHANELYHVVCDEEALDL